MPVPVLVERNGMIELDYDRPESFGRVKSFYGNFGVIVKAYAYIRSLGSRVSGSKRKCRSECKLHHERTARHL